MLCFDGGMARAADEDPGLPLKLWPCSNGEFLPPPLDDSASRGDASSPGRGRSPRPPPRLVAPAVPAVVGRHGVGVGGPPGVQRREVGLGGHRAGRRLHRATVGGDRPRGSDDHRPRHIGTDHRRPRRRQRPLRRRRRSSSTCRRTSSSPATGAPGSRRPAAARPTRRLLLGRVLARPRPRRQRHRGRRHLGDPRRRRRRPAVDRRDGARPRPRRRAVRRRPGADPGPCRARRRARSTPRWRRWPRSPRRTTCARGRCTRTPRRGGTSTTTIRRPRRSAARSCRPLATRACR